MLTRPAEPAGPEVYGLAEGPLWDPVRRRVLWVDINAGQVHFGELSGDRIRPGPRLSFGGTVGAVACSAAGDLLVAGSRRLQTVSAAGARTAGAQLIPAGKASRLNDGGCDPAGRFLVGSLALDGRAGQEVLVRVDDAGPVEPPRVTVVDDDLGLSNGLAFSPDGSAFYSIDTDARLVRIRDYDRESGHFGPRRDFLRITGGYPDGMCLDVDGNLWIAIWGAGQVRCFSPAGEHLATVPVAAPNVSSVAFVGDDLDVLLITTAAEQLSADQLARFPDSGKLFTGRVGRTGAPVPLWNPVPVHLIAPR